MHSTQPPLQKPLYFKLVILMIGGFIAYLNTTFMNVALPSIMEDLSVSPPTVQWLVTIYMLVSGILIPTTAYLIDKYSVRKLFLTAMSLFIIGNLIGGTAGLFPVLLTARVVQALGASILFPLIMNVMLTSFPIEKRGMAMGIYSVVMVVAPAIGPTLSGWIIEKYHWQMLFFSITPFALFVLISAYFILDDKKETGNQSLDRLSVIMSAIGLGSMLYGCSIAGEKGWGNVEVYGTLIAGALATAFFILRQFKLKTPMLEFRIFKNPTFSLSIMISIIFSVAMFSGIILLPIYFQTIRGISPLDSGLLMMPGAIIMGIMSPITGKLFDKFGARGLSIFGLTLTVVTSYAFSRLTLATPYPSLLLLYSVRMLGLSMVMMPIMTNALNQLPLRLNAHGTAMYNTLQQMSGSIGSAIMVTVMTTRTSLYRTELYSGAQPIDGMNRSLELHAMVEGLNDAFLVTTIITATGLFLSFFIKRSKNERNNKLKKSISSIRQR